LVALTSLHRHEIRFWCCQILGIGGVLWTMLWTLPVLGNEPARDKRPNILVVLTDDQSYETLGAAELCAVQTPHLDMLARQGTRFSHAYNMGSWSGAVCIASRTMLVTGRSLWRANAVQRRLDLELAAGRLWPDILRRAGYRTYMTGKWHVGIDPARVFDRVKNVRGGMPGQTPEMYNRPLAGERDVWSPSDPTRGGFWEGGRHWSEVVAEDAIGFLREAKADSHPFLMYVAFNAPHDPRQSPQEYVERYPPEEVEVPVNFLPVYRYHAQIGCGPDLRDERLGPFPRTEHAVRVHRGEYYALISHTDFQIGRILKALADSGLEQNTYVLFTADHGLAVGHHGLFGKQNMYDHSVRVPLIVKGPNVRPGAVAENPVYLQDIVPTTIELAGIQVPDHVDFKSLVPALRGETHRPYDSVYGAYLDQQRMITTDGFKLIVYPNVPVVRLFELANDPYEMFDLAGTPEYEPVVRKLLHRLQSQQQQFGDQRELAVQAVWPQAD
jgi:choline-sulfatase